MTRPRIIIADTDINYMIPLQLKFVEEFFDKADLEIVTDRNYFNELFAIPQRADILILSEELYDQSLQRHNISNIFLLTKQNEEERISDPNVSLIFKYTSIKEIFNEIMIISAGILKADTAAKREPQIILIYSACGGVGRTTVAMGISACLTKSYKRVLYMDAEHLQTFQRLLDNKAPVSSSDVYARLRTAGEGIYQDIKHIIRKEQFSYVPPFKAALMSLGLSYSVYKKIALSAKASGEYDYIIIDTDTAFDEEKAELIGISDKVVIVTEQTAASVYATNILAANVAGIGSGKYFFVCSNFDKDRDNALISPSMDKKFMVSDYVEHFSRYDQMRCSDLAKSSGIQHVALLVM